MATDYNTIAYLENVGDLLRVHYRDGQRVDALPDGRGRYLPRKGPGPVVVPPPDPDPNPGEWVHPAPGTVLTSGWGERAGGFHYGYDLSSTTNPVGVPVIACADLNITVAKDAYEGGNESAGTYVKGHTTDGAYTLSYAHGADNTLAVAAGTTVAKGTVLFYEGATGNVTGTHLHFEIHPGIHNDPWAPPWGSPVDPGPVLESYGVYV